MKDLCRSLIAGSIALFSVCSAQSFALEGAGASFPYPLYYAWSAEYAEAGGGNVAYESVGSSEGVRRISSRDVDFGASDRPLTVEELKNNRLIQFPMEIGGVVPVVRVDELSEADLRLSAQTLARIFLGEISEWNDPAVRADNPGLALPHLPITPVHRSDGSGTTFIFSHYLEQVSEQWRSTLGVGSRLAWPTGIAADGNGGVAARVGETDGAIGYVEFTYALANGLRSLKLRNREGEFVAPTPESFQAAAAGADWASEPGFGVVLTNQPGAESWPITGASFILMPIDGDPNTRDELFEFWKWCYAKGDEITDRLNYVPIPPTVESLVAEMWRSSFQISNLSATPR